jgi:alpha-beta hydrolase superfamily lysophospholipase
VITANKPRHRVLRLIAIHLIVSLAAASGLAQQPRPAAPGEAVVWFSQGTKMAGRVFLPKDYQPGKRLPTVVLVHGYTGTMSSLVAFAAAFADAGFLSFIFDYRGWGQSEGEKFRLDPFEQVEDIRNAITWVASRPECDASRIGVWGTSFGGGHVIYVGAIDERVKVIVGQVGAADGLLMVRGIAKWEGLSLEDYKKRLSENAALRALTGRGNMRPAWPANTPGPNGARRPAGANPMIPVETDEKLLEYRPILFAEKLGAKPVLLITAEKEELFDNKEHFGAVYPKLKGPKQLVEVPGITHYQVYFGPGQQKVTALAVDWFKKHLAGGAGR